VGETSLDLGNTSEKSPIGDPGLGGHVTDLLRPRAPGLGAHDGVLRHVDFELVDLNVDVAGRYKKTDREGGASHEQRKSKAYTLAFLC
jgi:hypothetical protein